MFYIYKKMKQVLSIILLPFSFLYGIIMSVRNVFFNLNIYSVTKFDIPIISIGNLSLGGTGKTPHIEYLINLLQEKYTVATISRGYKRETKGFILANELSTSENIGDEPLQIKHKFKNTIVAVDEKRVRGAQNIINQHPETNLILLDDAFQHRSIHRGLNIILTDYKKLYTKDFVIPSGTLREFSSGSDRADIIIVSKTPENITDSEKEHIIKSLNPKSHQQIFFSSIKYTPPLPFSKKAIQLKETLNHEFDVILLSGIAHPELLIQQLEKQHKVVDHLKFSDHHNFSLDNIKTLKERFINHSSNKKIIITTEKDIMRLSLPSILKEINDIPVFYIPIEIYFQGRDKEEFDKKILKYVTTNTGN